MSHIAAEGEQSTSLEILTLSNLAILPASGAGQFLRKTGLNTFENATPSELGFGTVTKVSIVSANGFAGTVVNDTTTPAITLTTTITGLLKGNGTAISAATDGTDYLSSTTGLKLSGGTMTGDILGNVSLGATGAGKLTKIWATDIEITNLPTINGGTLASALSLSGSNTGDQNSSDFEISDLTDVGGLRAIWSAKQEALTFGIANTNKVQIDAADVADNDYAKFTATGLEGRSYAEVLSDIGALANIVEDTTPELGGEMDAGAHSIGFTQQSFTGDGTTTIDWKLGNKAYFTFGNANETFTFTAPSNPCNLVLVLKQYSTGGKTATWPNTVMWPGGTAPTLSTGNNAIDIISFYYDGTNYYGVSSLNFSVPA